MYMDNIQILGFKGTINSIGETLDYIDSIKEDGEIIQLLNADSIVSKNHIIHGVNQALLAFDRGENLANDLSVEIALRCSAQRQISKAFNILGLKEGEMNLCVILINSKDHFEGLPEGRQHPRAERSKKHVQRVFPFVARRVRPWYVIPVNGSRVDSRQISPAEPEKVLFPA